jgi:hypothetical protein
MDIKSSAIGIISGLLLSFTVATSPASASIWNFSFSDASGDAGAGQITTTDTGPNFSITDITGTFNGQAITGLSSFASADNIFYSAGPSYTSFQGWSFNLDSSGPISQVNVWYGDPQGGNGFSGLNYYLIFNPPNSGGYYNDPQAGPLTSFAVTAAVPEASTWIMLILGFFGVGFIACRQRTSGTLRFA